KPLSVCAALALLLLAPAARSEATPRVLSKGVEVKAARAEVWRAFTTTEGARTFLAPDARIELRLGGAYELYFAPEAPVGSRGCDGCRVLSWVPEEMVSFTWSAPPSLPETRWQRTFVVVRLDDAGEGRTRVRLTHGGWKEGAEWEKTYAYFDKAWDFVLGNLKKGLESGKVIPAAATAPALAARKHYVYFIRPARAGFFKEPTEGERTALSEHVRYIKQLLAEGRLVMAGPAFDPPQYPEGNALALELPTPGLVVFEAEDDEEARRILEADPAVKAGVFKGRVNPFKLSFWRE
ncbi:MAG TPA: SRPBCC domain-containing protein, partial [Myxococcaceae bacterium]|nr:SRPBCC domain-containing protein [Myxococcaceae bacterium]